MQNVIKSKRSVTEEELAKIKEMDWKAYYRETASSETKGLSTCPKCNSIIIIPEDQEEVACYCCGEKISG